MKRMTIILGVALILLTPVVLALANDGYDLAWWTADGGGAAPQWQLLLSGTAGQPDAGTLTGGSYSLAGGFWARPARDTCSTCLLCCERHEAIFDFRS